MWMWHDGTLALWHSLPYIGLQCAVIYFLFSHLDLITDNSLSTALWDFATTTSHTLVNTAQLIDHHITPSIPLWTQSMLPERLLLPFTSLWLPWLRGEWWTFFRWIYATLIPPFYLLLAFIRPYLYLQPSFARDVRFWIPISLDVTLFGWQVLPTRPPKRPKGLTCHHQFGISVRVRLRRLPKLSSPSVPTELATQSTDDTTMEVNSEKTVHHRNLTPNRTRVRRTSQITLKSSKTKHTRTLGIFQWSLCVWSSNS